MQALPSVEAGPFLGSNDSAVTGLLKDGEHFHCYYYHYMQPQWTATFQ